MEVSDREWSISGGNLDTSSWYRGTDVANDQCGGAVSVEFTLPEKSKFGDWGRVASRRNLL
jgi:hypothetical protein